jgi:FkbM family methyltransferase
MALTSDTQYPVTGVGPRNIVGGGGSAVFDSNDAQAINQARLSHLASLNLPIRGKTVLDVGCGVGHLAQFFVERKCRVLCVDGREENIRELKKRYPDLEAHVRDVERESLSSLGSFDVVFCYGLLYHLENPVAGLRNIAEACQDLFLIETVISDYEKPIMRLEDEPPETPNQALGPLGSRPSPAFVVLSLSRLGFPYIYRPIHPPDHPDFRFTWLNNMDSFRDGHLLRCVFVASRHPIENPALSLVTSSAAGDPTQGTIRWNDLHWNDEAGALAMAQKLAFARPLGAYPGWTFGAGWDDPDIAFQARRRIWQYFHDRRSETAFVYDWYDGLRLNLHLGNDLSRQLFVAGCSEPNQFAVLDRILAPGMVFIDAGANDGLYTVFASKRVGTAGRVLAFEPSAREFDRLEKNVQLNSLSNTRLFRAALAEQDGAAELAVADYGHEGQNTLGGFIYEGVTLLGVEQVKLRRLDNVIQEEGLDRVDVIKLDVEGAEYKVLQGAAQVLKDFRPLIFFETSDVALAKQQSSAKQLCQWLTSSGYRLFLFDANGLPAPASPGGVSENMIAVPSENGFVQEFTSQGERVGRTSSRGVTVSASAVWRFNPAEAYWNQRMVLKGARERIGALCRALGKPSDLWPYQWAQLMAVVLDFEPDIVLELGRGKGNSTCAFTEAANLRKNQSRVVSVCVSDDWERETVPRLRPILPDKWFEPLQALRTDILDFDYSGLFEQSKRVVVFWKAPGFDIAECVLGVILPQLAGIEHLVIMHDLSDTRYSSKEQLEYGEHGLWKGNNCTSARVKLGHIDSAVEQSIAALDFATRNHLTLDSADHSFRTQLTVEQQSEMSTLLGDLFELQAHWFYFSLNERLGPYKFPHFSPPLAVPRPKRRLTHWLTNARRRS